MNSGLTLSKFYRNFAIGFFSLSVLLLLFLLYFIWAKVTIVITPNAEQVSHEFVIGVSEAEPLPSSEQSNAVQGKVRLIEVTDAKRFEASGKKPVVSDTVGEVTITNNYSQPQTLVESTRLAAVGAPDTTLVRLKSTVTVAPGEKVKVLVYPENPETFKELAPMRLIIPGLWGPLQEKIYAENSTALTKEGQTVSVVTAADLTAAENGLVDQLKTRAIDSINDQLVDQEKLWPKLVSVEKSDVSFDATEGQEAAGFTATATLQAAVVVFDENQVLTLAQAQLVGGDKKMVNINPKSLSYSIESYDLNKKTATVRVYIEGSSFLTEDSELLDKSKLTGKTADEVREYFAGVSAVQSVDVDFSPPWLQKTPRLKEKIEIRIKEQ